jgi:hypothetical protein
MARTHSCGRGRRTGLAVLALLAAWGAGVGKCVAIDSISDFYGERSPAGGPRLVETYVDGVRQFRTVDPTFEYIETPVNAHYLGRAAIVGDNTRLAAFAEAKFLPSAIPVPGQPFFGSDSRANLQGAGSAIAIDGYLPESIGLRASVHAQLAVDSADFAVADGDGNASFALRQVYARLNRLRVGVMESAFADPAAVPEILDLAGPSGRVTIYDGGFGGNGQGRLSYDLLSDEPSGFEIVTSVEQGIAELTLPTTDDQRYSRYPDFVLATQYVTGTGEGKKFKELWHVQWASVFRDLSFESPNSVSQSEFGWGTALSGAARFRVRAGIESLDRVVMSAAYGDGIAHYIGDLNVAGDTKDAVVNAAGSLDALSAFAWYTGYTHHWSDYFRSTASYSYVELDSTLPQGGTVSPYRHGNWYAVNLVYHTTYVGDEDADPEKRTFYTGVEYLFGSKETLNGAQGNADRVMFIVAVSK